VAQVAESLSTKHETLTSIPGTTRNNLLSLKYLFKEALLRTLKFGVNEQK
jgi:hypothetical protein